MKPELIKELRSTFELAVQLTEDIEFWFARDLQVLLGYSQWRNFIEVIEKAKIACTNAGQQFADHFVDVSKMVDFGSGRNNVPTTFVIEQEEPYEGRLSRTVPRKRRDETPLPDPTMRNSWVTVRTCKI